MLTDKLPNRLRSYLSIVSDKLQWNKNQNANNNALEQLQAVLNSAQSSPPTSPSNGDWYMDDGTNTADGYAGLRQYTNGSWEDIGKVGALNLSDLSDVSGLGGSYTSGYVLKGDGADSYDEGQLAHSELSDAPFSAHHEPANLINVSAPTVNLTDGDDLILHRETLGAGKSIKILAAGISKSDGTTGTTDLELQVYNQSDSTSIYSTAGINRGTYSSSLGSGGTADEIIIRLSNSTGADVDCQGYCVAVVE